MTAPATRLRELLAGEPFMAVECYNALTARIVERAGIPAAYMPGYPTGAMHFGIPDNGVLTTTEMVELAARVVDAIDIPLIVDADQGGESVADVFRTIRRFERAGVAGVHIEDEIPPKHSHHFRGGLLSVDDMAARIEAAVSARRSDDFVVIARSDELWTADGVIGGGGGNGSLEDAIRRGIAYAEAGADAFMPTLATPEQVRAIEPEMKVPIVYYGGKTPGAQVCVFTGVGLAAAARAHQEVVAYVVEHGEYPPYPDWPERTDLIDEGLYEGIVKRWAEHTGRGLPPET